MLYFPSLTFNGTAINTSGTQSGTHSYLQSWFGLGDGATTFNMPDLRGKFIRSWNDNGTVNIFFTKIEDSTEVLSNFAVLKSLLLQLSKQQHAPNMHQAHKRRDLQFPESLSLSGCGGWI